MDYRKRIAEKLSKGLIIPVVGAGVSYATAGMPGWKGLIENGIRYARSLGKSTSQIQNADTLLLQNKLIEAASIVKMLLNGPKHPFPNWLNDVFERPRIHNTALIESIQNLCQPIIATTNYDDLLRTVGAPQTDMALDWSQHEEIQTCLNQHRHFILHLHGIYTRPHTPIFAAEDYTQLKGQVGYKTILQQLWMQRSFLFIGCSRDGVMDEDFATVLKLMKEWFPAISNEHYILMPESEVGSMTHMQLLHECNVHLVPFGKAYSELPDFINGINPNATEIVIRHQQRKDQTVEGIKAILKAQPTLELDARVKAFIKETLGSPYYWLDNDKIQIFNEALAEYNMGVLEKKERFQNMQILFKGIINISELKKKIRLWKRGDTVSMSNKSYIDTAILAYELLKGIPKEMMDDISLRHYNVVHHGYFSGHLDTFYNEAKSWKESGAKEDELYGDDYFFENLRRIMDSLLAVLKLKVEEVYQERDMAIVAKELPKDLLLIRIPKRIIIAAANPPMKVMAELPWFETLDFATATMINCKGERLVVGCNDQFCFKWNPTQDLIPESFFRTQPDEEMIDLAIIEQGSNTLIEVYTTKRRLLVANFTHFTEMKISAEYSNYQRMAKTGRVYCTLGITRNVERACIFEYSSIGEYIPVAMMEDIWKQLLTIDAVAEEYASYLASEGYKRFDQVMRPYFSGVYLKKAKWKQGREILILSVDVGFGRLDSTALFFVDPEKGFTKTLLKVYFPHKNCFTFDTVSKGVSVDLIIGYLDTGNVGNLIQYFKDIQNERLIIATSQPGIVPQNLLSRSSVRDMMSATFISKERALVIEEGKCLIDIKLPDLTHRRIPFKKGIQSVAYFGNEAH